jgi:ABC-type phosphate/phosphonate transport system substrate-binding protein
MKRVTVLVLILAACTLISRGAEAEVKFGLLAERGHETAVKEWKGLIDYLSQEIGEKVVLVPLKYTEVRDFMDREPSGLMFTDPWFFVRAKVMKGAQPMLTVKYQWSGETMGGVIFTRADSGIANLEDMRGKVVMCPRLTSPGGWLFAKGVMVRGGLKPEQDFKRIVEAKGESSDEVIYAVRDKEADVGTVRTGVLETMQGENKITISDFRVIHRVRHEGFPQLCSTPLYPDWPVYSLRGTAPETVAKMKNALLTIPDVHPALWQAGRIERFLEPLSYAPMEELLRLLRMEPFRHMR